MEGRICIGCLLIFLGLAIRTEAITYNEETRRHHIYWDSKVSKSLRDPKYTLRVEIGQFMDIICPFRNYLDDSEPPSVFDLYNVTEDGYRTCDPTVPASRMIFSCDLPDQENKLTVKFQRISPSPFGFKFRQCEEYYFIAVKRDSVLAPPRRRRKYGCSRESERLRIVVGCPYDKKKLIATPTTTTTTTKTDGMMSDDVVVDPPIQPIESNPPAKSPARASSRSGSDPGRNGSSRTAPTNVATFLIVTLLSTFWISKQFLSTW